MKSFPLRSLPLRRSQVACNKAFFTFLYQEWNVTLGFIGARRPTAKGTHRPVIGDAVCVIPLTFRIPYISSFSTAPKNVIEYTFSRNPYKSGSLARDAAPHHGAARAPLRDKFTRRRDWHPQYARGADKPLFN